MRQTRCGRQEVSVESGRTIFASGVILGAAIGFSAGHLALWGRYPHSQGLAQPTALMSPFFQTEPAPFLSEPEFLPPELGEPGSALTTALATEVLNSDGLNAVQNSTHEYGVDPTITALLDQSGAVGSATDDNVPLVISEQDQQLLPPVKPLLPRQEPPAIQVPHAVPLTEHDAAREKEIRDLVDQQLHGTPETQRDVWFDSLRDLSVEDATNVLKMWKQFGGPSRKKSPIPSVVEPLTPIDKPASLPKLDEPDEPRDVPGLLEQAREVSVQNLLNLREPGYRQRIPVLGTSLSGGPTQLFSRVNFSQGVLEATESPFDWAIEGEGFFVVTDGQQTFYTRAGHWTVDDNRKLVLAGSQPKLSLQVDWSIPADASTVSISPDGEVSITVNTPASEGESDPPGEITSPEKIIIGQVQLARFLNPNGLASKSGALFAETPASGPAQLGNPLIHNYGSIQQGVLELSNVDLDAEQASVKHIDSLILSSQRSR